MVRERRRLLLSPGAGETRAVDSCGRSTSDGGEVFVAACIPWRSRYNKSLLRTRLGRLALLSGRLHKLLHLFSLHYILQLQEDMRMREMTLERNMKYERQQFTSMI